MVVVVEIAGEVKIAILRVRSIVEESRLLSGCCLETLSEWNCVVPVPAPKRRHVSPPAVLSSVFLIEQKVKSFVYPKGRRR